MEFTVENIGDSIIAVKYANWNLILSDVSSYPSSEWEKLLDGMKNNTNPNTNIGGGGNSYWGISTQNGNVEIGFDISGNGGDSGFTITYTNEEMIPVIEAIIVKIHEIEQESTI